MIKPKDLFKKIKKTADGLELEVDNISTTNILGMFDNLEKYMAEKGGYIDPYSFFNHVGMPNNPAEIEKTYSYKKAKFTIHTKRIKHYENMPEIENRHEVKLTLTSRYPVEDLVKEFCMSCFRHYLIPEKDD